MTKKKMRKKEAGDSQSKTKEQRGTNRQTEIDSK